MARFRKPMLYPLSYEGETCARNAAHESYSSLRHVRSKFLAA